MQTDKQTAQPNFPQPTLWHKLLCGDRTQIAEAASVIVSSGLADEYANRLLRARQRGARRQRRLFGLVTLATPYRERERRSALVALGIFWGPSGREVAIALDPKASHFERENAHKALIRRRDQRAVRPLLDALMGGYALEDWQCIATLGALGALGGERQLAGALLKYVGLHADTDRPLHVAAEFGIEVGRALYEMNAEDAFLDAKEALQAPLARQRASAALVLAGWHDGSVVPAILPLLNDSDTQVQSAAARALDELNVTESVPVLEAHQSEFSV